MFLFFLAGGYNVSFTSGCSTVSQFQAHFSEFLPWSRGPQARAAGGSLHTGAILKALSAGGVSGSLPTSGHTQPQGSNSSLEGSALHHKLDVVSKFSKLGKTRLSPIDAP